jgi:hypothetical protein
MMCIKQALLLISLHILCESVQNEKKLIESELNIKKSL